MGLKKKPLQMFWSCSRNCHPSDFHSKLIFKSRLASLQIQVLKDFGLIVVRSKTGQEVSHLILLSNVHSKQDFNRSKIRNNFKILFMPRQKQWSLPHLSGLVAAGKALNVALVASQWQHRAWTVPLHSPINVEHEAGHAASTLYQDFGMTRPEIESHLPSFSCAWSTTAHLPEVIQK